MAYTSLMDGGLSVKIAGTEYKTELYNLNFGSSNQGDGPASFWLEVSNPFNPQADYPELWHGAAVEITHTFDSNTTTLYKGFVITDPRAGVAGEQAFVNVDCGGPLEVAKWRGDLGWLFTDGDTSQWFANKRNAAWSQVDTDGGLYVGASEDSRIPRQRAAIASYVPYLGADYLLKGNGGPNDGAKRITGTLSYDLRDNMKARLAWSSEYIVTRVPTDSRWTEIHTWGPGGREDGTHIDYSFGGANGAGHVALLLWTAKDGGTLTTDERYAQINECIVRMGTNEWDIDSAMELIRVQLGMATSSSTANIGSDLTSLVARPMTDAASALASLAQQANCLVEWGWFRGQWRCKPLLTNPSTIRDLTGPSPSPYCYKVNAQNAGVDWEVTQHPEDGIAHAIRILYGKVARSTRWPAGTPASQIAPVEPGFATGKPFLGYTCPVMVASFDHNWTDKHAQQVAKALARHLGMGLSSGTVRLRTPTVPIYSSGTRPSTYIQGGDFIEEQNSSCGPLYITDCRVNADTDEVTLTVGLSESALIEQLVGQGNVNVRRYAPRSGVRNGPTLAPFYTRFGKKGRS